MPTVPYYIDDEKIPGTTTVIQSLGWNKGALMWWAWKEGKEGRNFRDTSKKACDAGTYAHALCESKITGKSIDKIIETKPTAETKTLGERGFQAYETWEQTSRIEMLHCEISLISKKHRYGGTIDAVGKMDLNGETKYYLIDFKTSNGTYADHLIQLAAYENLLLENKIVPQIDGSRILRFDKEHADFHDHAYTDLKKAWEAFLCLRTLHDIKKPLEKRAK